MCQRPSFCLVCGSANVVPTPAVNSWPAPDAGQKLTFLAVDLKTPATLYVGGFRGLSKSTDGGLTWAHTSLFDLDPPSGVSTVTTVAIDPSDPRKVYVGLGESFQVQGLY